MIATELIHEREQTMIYDILGRLKEAWNRGDATAFGALFAEDADYTVWNGIYDKGREAIIKSHAHIFGAFYRNSTLDGDVVWARFLNDDVALVQMTGQITLANGQPAGYPTRPLAVLHRQNGSWLITAWQNTPVMPHPLADAPETGQEPA